MSVKSLSLNISNFVYTSSGLYPSTWVLDPQRELNGWQWDRRLLTDTSKETYQFPITAEGCVSGLLNGYSQEDWQSGVVTGITLSETVDSYIKDNLYWIPKYTVGNYSVFWDNRKLFSDYSASGFLNIVGDNGLYCYPLHPDYQASSINVAIYSRNEDGLITTHKQFNYVDVFTGELADETRLETEAAGNLIVDNISLRHNEFIIRDNVVYVNYKPHRIGLGETLTDIEKTWLSYDVSAGSIIFLPYISPMDIVVKVIRPDRSIQELTQFDDLAYIKPDQTGFFVDCDLGTIEVSGLTTDPVVLFQPLSETDTYIQCYPSLEFSSFPAKGIIKIGTEYISFNGKSNNGLENCVRGIWGSEAASHLSGARIDFSPRGSFVEGDYYVSYKAVPRIDYEITTYDIRSANANRFLNVHNLVNSKSNKIIQLMSTTPTLDSVVLSTDEAVIGGNLYGPLYFGTDVGRLTATAYDAFGNPVEDILLTIEIVSGPGLLNSISNSISGESNSSGELNVFFNAPYDSSETMLEASLVEHSGTDTIMTVPNIQSSIQTSEISIYQCLKHDPALGSVGKRIEAIAAGSASLPQGLGYIDCLCMYTEEFNNGILQLVVDDIRYTFSINKSFSVSHPDYGEMTRFYTNEYNEVLDTVGFSGTAWLYSSDAEVWDPAIRTGVNVLVYEFSSNYQHPITNISGAYGPLRPNSQSGETLKFSNRHLPIPEPENDSSNLGTYYVVGPTEVRFRAYGTDPYTNKTVVSNDIRFKIVLPNSLMGVDSTGILPVPYGFTFGSEEFNIGGGLGGANFITVNPKASGISQFTIKGSL